MSINMFRNPAWIILDNANGWTNPRRIEIVDQNFWNQEPKILHKVSWLCDHFNLLSHCPIFDASNSHVDE